MALTYSEMIDLGTMAPAFDLPIANPDVDDLDGPTRSVEDYDAAEALVVVFICNHCPYVHAIEERLIALAKDYAPKQVQVVAISSNDVVAYPADSFDNMTACAAAKGYPFPYLYDESQEVARAYSAVCTPDFFVFDADRALVYRGRLDDGRPSRPDVTQHDLRNALDELLDTGAVASEQIPSMGCSIKWK
ncbi:MAG: thioredoxin family protein [Bacteroidota bacterium]